MGVSIFGYFVVDLDLLLDELAPPQAGVLDESAVTGVRPPDQLSLGGPPEEPKGARPPAPPPLPRPIDRGCFEIGLLKISKKVKKLQQGGRHTLWASGRLVEYGRVC
jgi:hypothetical protein